MGAWGYKSFENDDALDWVFELGEAEDFSILSATFDELFDEQEDDYLDAYYCARALAAGEVVAALKGKAAEELPDEVTAWLEDKAQPAEDLTASAIKAVGAVVAASELKELWEETDEFGVWQADVQGLLDRLG
ncbi:MAG: DUF4259 domain-containing protein [Chloroflexi bacterium]|nr:MAG: DUF4259 domain-containing protein [Chloroflexota bacterium]MBL1195409.1 DUF4259 domain-containing protein [Chloroflexota bacterium]NOH12692.1 DUF4259 domain-containing protein [Chloroflexota bacterium]